jgi:hypothetical protein
MKNKLSLLPLVLVTSAALADPVGDWNLQITNASKLRGYGQNPSATAGWAAEIPIYVGVNNFAKLLPTADAATMTSLQTNVVKHCKALGGNTVTFGASGLFKGAKFHPISRPASSTSQDHVDSVGHARCAVWGWAVNQATFDSPACASAQVAWGANTCQKSLYGDFTCEAQLKAMLKTCSYAVIGSKRTDGTNFFSYYPPPKIVYTSTSMTLRPGIAMSRVPVNSGGAIRSCTVTPALPSGLTLNSRTCEISGTPSIMQATKGHTITASSLGTDKLGGTQTVVISITVTSPKFIDPT